MQHVEIALEWTVRLYGEQHRAVAAKEEVAFVNQQRSVSAGLNADFVRGDLTAAERRRSVGVIEREAFRYLDINAIVFGPRIVEIDRILSIRRGEEWSFPVLKERGLEEESFAGALRIIRNTHVESVDERLGILHDIFDFDIVDFSRAHLFLELFSQVVFALTL